MTMATNVQIGLLAVPAKAFHRVPINALKSARFGVFCGFKLGAYEAHSCL